MHGSGLTWNGVTSLLRAIQPIVSSTAAFSDGVAKALSYTIDDMKRTMASDSPNYSSNSSQRRALIEFSVTNMVGAMDDAFVAFRDSLLHHTSLQRRQHTIPYA